MANETTTQAGAVGLPVGARIGKYEVRERIGTGGQATVYKCYDAILDRYVAIKQISTHLAEDPKFLERFRREAQILAKLSADQPAIVMIHDLVEDERGLFIVMEFVPGHTLETVLNDTPGPVEPKAVLQILWRLASALHDVHKAGIIHRDIKPGNIIIAEGLRPKITDFGVAASITGQTSMVLGTTKYMAPELYSGGTVDGRADMYSLGFITYEMLVGRPRFNEIFEEVVRDKHSEALRWMKWHGNEAVVAPRVQEVNASVPGPLSGIVARMISKNPQDRYENMEALGRAVKMSFSPRGKAPAGVDARMPRRQRARAAVASSRALASVAESPAGARPDEGDELELQAPATAPIPKKKLSRRAKLSVAGALLVVLLGALLFFAISKSQKETAREEAARKAYQGAKELYDKEEYRDALKVLQEVRQKHPNTVQWEMAGVLIPMCNARLIVVDPNATAGDMQRATEEQEKAREVATALQAKTTDEALKKWTRDIIVEIEQFGDLRHNTQIFREAIASAQESARNSKLDEARNTLDEKLRGVTLMAKQKEEFNKFMRDMDLTELRGQLDGRLKTAEDLLKAEKFLEARKEFQVVLKLLDPTQTKRAELLAPEERVKTAADVDVKLKAMDVELRVRAAMVEYEQATDNMGKIKALKKANAIRHSPEREAEISKLELAVERDEVLRAIKEGRTAHAILLGRKYLEKDPNNAEIREALAQLEGKKDQMQLVNEGTALMAAGKYDEAIARLKKAAEVPGVPPVPEIAEKIRECKYQMKYAEAEKYRADRNFAAAEKAYQECLTTKPEAEAAIKPRLVAMQQEQQYCKLRDDGDAALERKEWARATQLFKQAKAIKKGDEIEERLNLTTYKQHLALGLEAMDKDDPKTAVGYFGIAQKAKDTAELRELLLKAQKRAKEKEARESGG